MFRSVRLFLFCASCLSTFGTLAGEENTEVPAIKVVATFSILADLVMQVGGEHVSVYSLVDFDEDAHVFHASPRDIKAVRSADLLVMNGLGYEGWISRVVSSSGFKGAQVIASRGVSPILEHDHIGHHHHHHSDAPLHDADPHAWHSISAVIQYVKNITAGLQKLDAANRANYAENAARYIEQLEGLKLEVEQALKHIAPSDRNLVVPHNSFAYLAREFNMNIFSLQGVSTEAEASASDIAKVIRQIRARNVRAIFVENVSNPRLVEQVERETQARVGGTLVSDALSSAGAKTYIDMMRHNLQVITQALM